MKKVSIIVPVYNGEKFIDRCLTSLLNQTYKSIEVVVINDGSTDNSLKVLKKYHNKIKLINQENQGISKARNNCLSIATGEYIMFCDVDDWYEVNTVEIAMKNIGKNDLLKFCERRVYNDNTFALIKDNIELKVYKEKDVLKLLEAFYTFNCFAHIMKFLFKKSIIVENNILFDHTLRYGEDIDYLRRYIEHTSSFIAIEDCLYNYYENVDSFTNNYSSIVKNLASLKALKAKTVKALSMEMICLFEQFLLILVLLNLEKLQNYKDIKIKEAYKEVCNAMDGFFDEFSIKDKNIKWKVFIFILDNKWYRMLNLYIKLYLKLR